MKPEQSSQYQQLSLFGQNKAPISDGSLPPLKAEASIKSALSSINEPAKSFTASNDPLTLMLQVYADPSATLEVFNKLAELRKSPPKPY